MKNKKHIYMLLIFLVFMLTISAASAAEDTERDISSINDCEGIVLDETPTENNLNDANDELILEESPNEETLNVDENTPLSEPTGDFADLNTLINGNTDSEVTLDRNYTYSESDDLKDGITINRAVTINGNGYTINADGKARIFHVTNSSVVFKDIVFTGGCTELNCEGGAIWGECTSINCNFTNNQATNGGAISGGTAINCTFIGNNAKDIYGEEGRGGAIYKGIATDCNFTNNIAGGYGGAIFLCIARGCNFIGNNAFGGGGMCGGLAIASHFESNTVTRPMGDDSAINGGTAVNCTFNNNVYDEMTVVCQSMFIDINDLTGNVTEGEELMIFLYGRTSYGAELEVYTLKITIDIYKDGDLFTTKEFDSCTTWKVDLPLGNYIANASVKNVPEVESVEYAFEIVESEIGTVDTIINITSADIKYGEDAAINFTLKDDEGNNLNGTLLVAVGDVNTTVTVENGVGNTSISGLAPGKYTIIADYIPSGIYLPSSARTTITVQKANVDFNVIGDKYLDYGDNAIVTVTLMDGETGINGTVIVTVAGVNYSVDVIDGEGELNISGLIPSNYEIKAKFIGNDYYNESIFDGDAYIEFYHNYANFDVIIPDGNYGDNLTVLIENATDLKGNKLNGLVYGLIYDKNSNIAGYIEVEVIDGSGTNIISPFYAGNLHASLKFYSDDDAYRSQSLRYDFNIAKAAPAILANYANGKLEITLDGVNGEKLNETITIAIDGEEKDYETNNGAYTLEISDLGLGKHSAYVVFKGNDNYLARSAYAVFTCEKKLSSQIICQNMTVTAVDTATDGRVGKYFTITLKDKNGKPLANKAIQIGFNGKAYDRVTDKDGKASLQINLNAAGGYTFAVCYLGDDDYEGTFVVAKITVKAQKGSLTVPAKSYKASAKTKTLTATFKSASGKLVKGKKVTFTVNGNTYSATTNAKGVATVKVSLNKKGTYKFTAKFAGDKTYAAISKTGKLTIK